MQKSRIAALGLASGTAAALASYYLARRKAPELRDQVVLITGGSRGLGLRLACEFANRGCRIALCARNSAELEEARRVVAGMGAEVVAIPCDVSQRDQVERLVKEVSIHFGGIDILVNNAGVIRVGPVENMTEKDFDDAMAVMFWGVVHTSLAVLPQMVSRKKGRIATITSIGGKVSIPHLLPYSCAKHAAVAFSEGLRAEVASRGVKVITVAPGLMRTGSHLNAQFKGKHVAEAAWFSLGASLPLISMDVDRAARQIVTAIERGTAVKILSSQASLLARFHGLFPSAMPNLLGLISRALPNSTGDLEKIEAGSEAMSGAGLLMRFLTILGTKAALRLNETDVHPKQPAADGI